MTPNLELWGGVECTLNRVGAEFYDQIRRSGHDSRADDLERFAELGFSKLRVPILWERICPESPNNFDWAHADFQLSRVRELGIEPIVGFVHHGSGPRFTNLLDPQFPEHFANFARAFIERYPWVQLFNPINEPLTTARFSALYGFWYPHKTDDVSFCHTLIIQCKAVLLAMQSILKMQPLAQLIPTEDLGRVSSTPILRYQADFENERRWLSFDLLLGKVTRRHPLWNFLRERGKVNSSDLKWFEKNAIHPSTLGINHYLTSNRFLDDRTELYPESMHGGNGTHSYCDVEALRVGGEQSSSIDMLLSETWQRYHLPLAITEVHLGCTREEQVRWAYEVWQAALRLKSNRDIPVRAVTLWALLGSFEWNSLVTRNENHYESGVFDLRASTPRATLLAHFAKSISQGKSFEHPILDETGWWRRNIRVTVPEPLSNETSISPFRVSMASKKTQPRRILITGAGTLGKAFSRITELRGLPSILLDKRDLDIANRERVFRIVQELKPWAIINAAGFVKVDEAETNQELCWRQNVEGARTLAEASAHFLTAYLSFSTDLVFDGQMRRPYLETDVPLPLNIYGASKKEAEKIILEAQPDALIVRTSSFFGPWDEFNFLVSVLREIEQGKIFLAANDVTISPTYVPDLVHACLDLLIDGESNIWHLSNPASLSWEEFAKLATKTSGRTANKIKGVPHEELGWTAKRPSYSALGSSKSFLMPNLEKSLADFFTKLEVRI